MLISDRKRSPIRICRKVKKPLLLIAGKKDSLVKVEEIQEFYERNRKSFQTLSFGLQKPLIFERYFRGVQA